ncbi:MAG: hypothetical protein DRQ02_11380 [Candidatus Latescibacterota bacterium]|nr:MAG: hypothetical protein DRQ02_11380 [Candidatus Latescibacterota bacterium]
MMKRYVFIVFLFIVLSINPAPYKPYPILFVHGMGSKSLTWGADVFKDEDTGALTDSIKQEVTEGSTIDHFLRLMTPYAIAWDEIDPSYTHPGGTPEHPNPDPGYPNKAFLEVVNFDNNRGSLDAEEGEPILEPREYRGMIVPIGEDQTTTRVIPVRYDTVGWKPSVPGWGNELLTRIREVLEEYYGEGWEDNPDAKVIIVAHSMGVFSIRYHPKMEYKSLAVGCQLIVHQITRG